MVAAALPFLPLHGATDTDVPATPEPGRWQPSPVNDSELPDGGCQHSHASRQARSEQAGSRHGALALIHMVDASARGPLDLPRCRHGAGARGMSLHREAVRKAGASGRERGLDPVN